MKLLLYSAKKFMGNGSLLLAENSKNIPSHFLVTDQLIFSLISKYQLPITNYPMPNAKYQKAVFIFLAFLHEQQINYFLFMFKVFLVE